MVWAPAFLFQSSDFRFQIHMTSRYARALVLLITFFSLGGGALPAYAQRGNRSGDQPGKQPQLPPKWKGDASVKGKVTDDTGKPVAAAKVTFVFTELNTGFFVPTRKNGEFEAEDMKPGAWRLQVDAPNFIVVRQDVTIAAKNNPPIAIVVTRDNSPELLTKAEALFKAGKDAEARAEYMTVLAAHPELTAINRAIAFTYGHEKNHPEALKYLDLALASNPNDATLLQLAAASAMEVSDYPRAMGYLGRIDEATLTDPEMMVNAAMNLLNRRRSAEATTVLTRVIGHFPTATDAFFYRAYAAMQAGKPADAKPDLEECLRLAPSGPLAAQAKEMLSRIP
jgi:Tfp pilus assembly protein PilF